MDKVRVYELARELGITSPEAIALLKEKLKIRVKSASSTIEEDTAIKLKRLLRLEGASAIRKKAEKTEMVAVGDGSRDTRSARKRRAEKARLALLQEMDDEDRAAKEKIEKAAHEKEERERREAEEAALKAVEAEHAREEAAAATALAELEAIGEDDAEPPAGVGEDAATEGPAENAPVALNADEPPQTASAPMPGPMDRRVDLSRKPKVVADAPKTTPAPKLPPKLPPVPPSMPAAAPPVAAATPAAPGRESFVPGPTSQFVRMRPAPPRPAPGAPGGGARRDPARPSPPRPRPAAPIKRVPARADEGKPKSKRKGRRPQRAAAVPDVAEQALPEPMPRLDDRKPAAPKIFRKIALTEGVTVKELAEKLEVKHKDVIKVLLARGVLATINQTLGADSAKELAAQFGAEVEILSFEEDVLREEASEEKPEDLVARAPVVTVMGHVDHGKTSLLDAIRETKVVEKEAGGITQHVGAYSVNVNQRSVVFLDTPGHEAFTLMRARGAGVTDLVVLVVAADDGVMPQTREAIDHARAANVPVLVAVNKIDKPNANPDRVKQQLNELELVPEDWGGSTVFVEVSAKKREGLDLLLEMILLVADLRELKANPERAGMGTVLEAKLDKGKGPVAHVLIQNGSVEIGDPFIAGAVHGKVRAMLDDRGRKVKKVGPSSPVEILGLTSLPQAGDQFQVFGDSFKARQISEFRQQKLRERELASSARLTLDHLHQQVQEGGVKELRIIVKADVQGSAEVLTDTLQKLSTEKVKIKIILVGVGAITDNDVTLALASNAIIIGFNIRPERSAEEIATKENIDIRLHTVIYNITDELKKAMEGLLDPTFTEVTLGRAEIRDTFKVPKIGVIAGCYVSDGKVLRNADIRLLRDNVVVFEGKIGSLRRFKDDASEVKEGFECGIGLAGYNDVKVGDVIEAFTMEKVQPTTA
ncbi:MAG: hypothetical protein BMS9Abin37_0842 [Acidobacteriota bacterium]|nr:MAG: hypothetical protein BMS9Abin37_0842 [Acidobacteriota bacterium]